MEIRMSHYGFHHGQPGKISTIMLVRVELKKARKLNLRFIGSYDILERIRPVAYRLALPSKLEKIHNTFHVSILHCYRSDFSHVISPDKIELQPDMYSEEPIKILA
ncbi:receptor-like protein kinase [Gossypium australe]|uniref:Receptor-like protein kinase n=1 Tax=Gossypium australe TaxID=47621 RepID=A0A5B6W950_9ROSI|nr:receptor-like protein kinase [Gossypium australe]